MSVGCKRKFASGDGHGLIGDIQYGQISKSGTFYCLDCDFTSILFFCTEESDYMDLDITTLKRE